MAKQLARGQAHRLVTIHREGDGDRHGEDCLAEEVPVELRYNGQPFAVMMATPADLEDFACGFTLSESIVGDPAGIRAIDVQVQLEGVVIEIDAPGVSFEQEASRLLPGRSGCGLCGTRRLEDVLRRIPPVPDGPVLAADALERALAELGKHQPLNAETGAMHAAAWVSPSGAVRLVREDVGRHNALDKLLGALVRRGADFRNGFVLVTSRASYEMVTKAATLGVGLLAAISAPTALAVDLARGSNMTLVGFVRPGRHVVYARPTRLRADQFPSVLETD